MYSQRNKNETIVSVIKRLFGEHIASRLVRTQNREISFRCIAYNAHRLTNLTIIIDGFYKAISNNNAHIRIIYHHIGRMRKPFVFTISTLVILVAAISAISFSIYASPLAVTGEQQKQQQLARDKLLSNFILAKCYYFYFCFFPISKSNIQTSTKFYCTDNRVRL